MTNCVTIIILSQNSILLVTNIFVTKANFLASDTINTLQTYYGGTFCAMAMRSTGCIRGKKLSTLNSSSLVNRDGNI